VIVVDNAARLLDHVGTELGVSDWITLTEQDIQAFAEVTRDRHWVHTDRDRAARETPFGGVLAHGFLVLALITDLANQCYTVRGATRWLNYGLDRVRFTAPVRAGDELRLRTRLTAVEPSGGTTRLNLECTVELRGSERPAAVATWIVLVVEDGAS
jgi:acyl dehydratase